MFPVAAPDSDQRGVAVAPFGLEFGEAGFGCIRVGGGVDVAEFLGDLRPVLGGGVLEAGADHVDHAQLHIGLRPGVLDRVRQPFQPVAAGDQDVFDAAVAELGQPGLGAFAALADPHAQHIPLAFEVDPDRAYTGRLATAPSLIFTTMASIMTTA